MNPFIKSLLCLAVLFYPSGVFAQWSFKMSVQTSGNCSGLDVIAVQNVKGMINHYLSLLPVVIPTRTECESLRSVINGYVTESGGCRAYISCTPCVGRDINGGSIIAGDMSYLNNYQLLGPDQGRGTFTSNVEQDIENWQREWEEKKRILSPYMSPGHGFMSVSTGDSRFDETYSSISGVYLSDEMIEGKFISINYRDGGTYRNGTDDLVFQKERLLSNYADMERVRALLEKVDFSMSLHDILDMMASSPDMFRRLIPEYILEIYGKVSGTDIKTILNKTDLSQKELQEVYDYYKFTDEFTARVEREILDEKGKINKKELDMAILSQDCYNNGDSRIGYTDYRIVGENFFMNDNQYPAVMQDVFSAMEVLNNQGTGFFAQLYYNDATGEFTVAFRGSELNLKDWIVNYENASGELTHQHGSAYTLSVLLKKADEAGVKVNATGHSLGGGLASVVGVITGLPTYTFNAAGVSDNALKKYLELETHDEGIIKVSDSYVAQRKKMAESNICAISSSKDVVTMLQEEIPVAEIAKMAEMESEITEALGGPASMVDLNKDLAKLKNISEAIGNKVRIEDAGWHSIEPLVEAEKNRFGNELGRWQQLQDVQVNLAMLDFGNANKYKSNAEMTIIVIEQN